MNSDDALNIGILLFWTSVFWLLLKCASEFGDTPESKINKKGTKLTVKLGREYDDRNS
jgi:hypothetical protein